MPYDPVMRWEWEGGAVLPIEAAPAITDREADAKAHGNREEPKAHGSSRSSLIQITRPGSLLANDRE